MLNFTDSAAEDNAPEDVMLSENNEDNINHISRLMLSQKVKPKLPTKTLFAILQ